MPFEFKSLGRPADKPGDDNEERKLFVADMAAEAAARGSAMSAPGARPAEPAASSGAAVQTETTPEDLSEILKKYGQTVDSVLEAEKRLADGHRVFVLHEMDGEPKEVTSTTEFQGFTSDRILTLPLNYGPVAEVLDSANPQSVVAEAKPVPVAAKAAQEDPGFSSLLKLAAGKIAATDVVLPKAATPKTSTFQRLDPSASMARDEDDLFAAVSSGLRADRKGAPGAVPTTPGQPGVAPVAGAKPISPTAVTVGEIVGRGVANVVATPFLAMSSAARHLTQRFGSKPLLSPIPPIASSAAGSLTASRGMALPMVSSLETITQWKCDRIEKVGREVESIAAVLMGTEEFVVWEDSLRRAAASRNMSTHDVVSRMHEDPDFSAVKSGMDALWKSHPDKVAAFRGASLDFENNLRNVVKEYGNSDRSTQERISTAMKSVEEKTLNLPGFGENQGEYLRTLAERIREIARAIAEFVQSIVSKVSGKVPATSELSA